MSTEFQRYGEYCCRKFSSMVDDNRIQLDKEFVVIWTCTGNTGKYATYGDPDVDRIGFCPFCGAKV